MDALLVDGDEIELTPDPPWMWMAPVRLSVTALPGHKIKADGKFTIWDTELMQAGLLAAGKMYTAPGFATPGSVITCTIVVIPATMSQVYKDLKLPIATTATSGTFLAAVVPAVNPATGVPDPLIAKTGTWKVVTEKQSVAKSGQLKPAQTAGDDGDGDGANASGGNAADAGTDEGKVHWVGVKYQDLDGNSLPDHRIAISTPDGRRAERKTTANGASRVDGVLAEGKAIASLLEANIRPGAKQPPVPFLGVSIVDEDGLPIAGVELGFTSPSGAELAGETNKKGAVRLDKLPELGTWTVKALKLPDGLVDGIGGGAGNGDGTGTDTGDGSGGNQSDADDKPTKRLFLLEVPDVLCRTNSCVLLPEGEAPSDSTEHPAVSGVGIFAMAIRLCEERPEFKLLIAAHTDTVDDVDDNQVLSNERAQMALAILTGDRESYKKLAHARHRISDVKQMLHWCTVAYPDVFTCDPGTINDKDDTWNAVHTFEQQYNECKFFFTSEQPDLKLTGEMGPLNWGALFDVLQHNIAQELGVKVKEVAALREKIQWLDDGRKALGFSEHHPIDAVGKDNYESQSNRRVELLFFKQTDILPDVGAAENDPAGSEIYLPGVYTRERFPTRPGGAKYHPPFKLRLLDPLGAPMVRDNGVEFRIRQGEVIVGEGVTTDGFALARLIPDEEPAIYVTWGEKGSNVRFSRSVHLDSTRPDETSATVAARLKALGFTPVSDADDAFVETVRQFQAVQGLPPDPITKDEVPASLWDLLTEFFDKVFEAPLPDLEEEEQEATETDGSDENESCGFDDIDPNADSARV